MSGLADRSAMLRRCLHVVWSVPLTDHNVAQVRSYTAFAVVYTLKRSFVAIHFYLAVYVLHDGLPLQD